MTDHSKPQVDDGSPRDALRPFEPGSAPEIPHLAEYDPGVPAGVPLFALYTPEGRLVPQSILAGTAVHPHHWRWHAAGYYMARGVHGPPVEVMLRPVDQGGHGWTVRRIEIHGLEPIGAEKIGEYYVHSTDDDESDECVVESSGFNPDLPVGQAPEGVDVRTYNQERGNDRDAWSD